MPDRGSRTASLRILLCCERQLGGDNLLGRYCWSWPDCTNFAALVAIDPKRMFADVLFKDDQKQRQRSWLGDKNDFP